MAYLDVNSLFLSKLIFAFNCFLDLKGFNCAKQDGFDAVTIRI